ncbi:MAG: macrolide ABC transporter ATP-binding protein [Candidatus Terrybacteria bacterium RIFCSPHIGHO2_01_FULL_48_17]|uniref:Macrolide ABC transporter ATP-binding protein n=1 Tax=Candidatus Terrybacteria bacterium RIFCSPHIGHO2_01_FULL_48_17 TaxID=1802362 RepID=A0A1G2PJN7_9BACT|nr:MAG: macrolide ABC transporter ATP-binding protein [Candidatus Terrybacteria bacterium RIFCSPHIGHO2_01_FULL_48_17]OHA53001.1 MAG: macrolide ABC transporter ATP-binding protein [Candidatus Terrybacteria bacterium RIFCSPLOWO2_01_FULL_48_14]
MLIDVSNVEKAYNEDGSATYALRGISFGINKGEFVAIMGPSGSGKSTLLHILSFLDRPSRGVYRFEGKAIEELSDDALAHVRNTRMGFVFQSFNLLGRTSVLNNVMLPLVYAHMSVRERNNKARQVIEQVGLSHRLQHFSNQLSGGEKQRVAIARAMVNEPSVIFADEPTGNLDSNSGIQIMKLLQELNRAGHTVVLVTHETYTAQHAQRIIFMRDGKIENDSGVKERRIAHDHEFLK